MRESDELILFGPVGRFAMDELAANFYIEAIPKKNLNSEKKYFFSEFKKNENFSDQKIFENVRQQIWGENRKSQNLF